MVATQQRHPPTKTTASRELVHVRSGRGNWHLLSESELTELCLALGVPPEQTGTMSKVGLIAALRTRLVMSKHRGDHGPVTSRFERLPAPAFADSRVEGHGSPPRRGLGDASRAHSRSRSSGALGDTSNRDTRTRRAAERRPKLSTWKRSANTRFDMTAEDLNDMEETFRQRLHSEPKGDTAWKAEQLSSTPAGTGEAENKLRWYENSVLEYGLQLNSMLQQGIGGEDAAASFPARGSGGPSEHSSSMAAGAGYHSDLEAMQRSFAQLERRMADTSVSIDDSCRAAAVGSTVDELLREREEPGAYDTAYGNDSRAASPDSARSARSAVSQVSSQGSEAGASAHGALGLAAWLENGGTERFSQFDRDGNGVLDRHELESAVSTFLAVGQGEDATAWTNAVQQHGRSYPGMPTGETSEAQAALRAGEEWVQRLRRDVPGLSVNAQLRE